jgi:hypothetical protein
MSGYPQRAATAIVSGQQGVLLSNGQGDSGASAPAQRDLDISNIWRFFFYYIVLFYFLLRALSLVHCRYCPFFRLVVIRRFFVALTSSIFLPTVSFPPPQ